MAAQYRLRGIDTAAPPWPLLIEVARETPRESWILVGGMMVHLHALRGRISATRPTTDVDLLLTLEAITRSISEVAGPLQSLGMRPLDSRGPFHRFTRGDDIVDIMVSNQAGRATWAQRPIMRASGATLALHDPDTYLIEFDGHDVRLSMPNTPAAIVLKAAAYRDDPRDRDRHLEDLAVLFAAAPPDIDTAAEIPRSQRKHLRLALQRLADSGHPAWQNLDSYERDLAWANFSAFTNG